MITGMPGTTLNSKSNCRGTEMTHGRLELTLLGRDKYGPLFRLTRFRDIPGNVLSLEFDFLLGRCCAIV